MSALSTTSAAPASCPSQSPRIFKRLTVCAHLRRADDLTLALRCRLGDPRWHWCEKQVPDQADDEDRRHLPEYEMRASEHPLVFVRRHFADPEAHTQRLDDHFLLDRRFIRLQIQL